jgi:hypothetical protein
MAGADWAISVKSTPPPCRCTAGRVLWTSPFRRWPWWFFRRIRCLRDKIHSYEIDDGIILHPARSNQFLVLNETAKIVWENHERGLSREEIARDLIHKYGISEAQAASDVSSVFQNLESAGLGDISAERVTDQAFSCAGDMSAGTAANIGDRAFGTQIGYSLNGRNFIIQYGNDQIKENVHAFLSHLEQRPVGDACHWYQYIDGQGCLWVGKDGNVIAHEKEDYLAQNALLTQIIEDAYSGVRMSAIIHAAAVGMDGKCMLMPAASGSGKSTLTAVLLKAGFAYFADDYIPLEHASFNALPVPFALSIKENSWPVLREFYPELDVAPIFHRYHKTVKYLIPPNVAQRQSCQRAPIHCIVCPKYDPGASTIVEEITAIEAFQNILQASAWIDNDNIGIGQLIDWLKRTKCYALSYSSLAEAVQTIKNLHNR